MPESDRAVSIVGPEALDLFRLTALRTAIRLYARTGMIPTRGVGITKLLRQVTNITQRRYTGANRFDCAIRDLTNIIEFRKAELARKAKGPPNAQD